MGSPVLQGQHPHFQLNQVRKKAQSLTLRGSASSVWGAGETVGAVPPLLTQSPGQTSRYMSVLRRSGLWSLSAWELETERRIWGQRNLPPGQVTNGKK